jgi:hypothetical protein
VLADYASERLNLEDPASFRDLSRPMGAQSEPQARECVGAGGGRDGRGGGLRGSGQADRRRRREGEEWKGWMGRQGGARERGRQKENEER